MKTEEELLAGYFSDLVIQYKNLVLIEIAKGVLGRTEMLDSVLYDLAHTSAKYGALRPVTWRTQFKSQFETADKLIEKNK